MIKDIYPLTPLQEGMLFHSLNREFDQTPYFEQTNFEIKGTFDIDIFQESWSLLVKRHDILRTLFVYKKTPKPRQIVLKSNEINLSYEEIVTIQNQKQYIKEFEQRDRERYFELSKENALRLKVFKLKDNLHRVIFSSHHILLDGWSIGILFEEFFEIYLALKSNKSLNLAPPKPYSNYIKWLGIQRKILLYS